MSAKKKSCLDTDTSRYILIGMQNKCNDGNTSKDLRGKNKKFLHINSFMKLKKKCILFLNNWRDYFSFEFSMPIFLGLVTKGCVSLDQSILKLRLFRSIHFETAFVYISFAPQEYMVISVYCFEQDDDSK